jgi:hypothetical protein
MHQSYTIGSEEQMKAMEDGGNTVVNLMFEAKEVTGKPQTTSNAATRKMFASDKYMNKTFFHAEKALFRESETAPTLEKQDTNEDDEWLDFDDLFPSPESKTTKSLSPKRNHSNDEIGDAAFPADFPAFPDFDDWKADLGHSKRDLGLSQSTNRSSETTRRRSLDHDSTFLDDKDASRPTVANTKPRRNSHIDADSSSKQHIITMEMSKPARISGQKSRSFNEAQRRRRSLDKDFSPFTGKLAEEDLDIEAVARSRSLDDNFPIFDADDDYSSFPMPLAKKEKEEGLSKSSARRRHSYDRDSLMASSRRALSPFSVATAATTGGRSRSLDSDFLFDMEDLPTRPRTPTRKSANAELSKSLHPSFKVSTKRQSSKDKTVVFGEAQLPSRSRSPMRNSADAELSQSLHPSFKVSPKRQSSKDKPLIFGEAQRRTRSRSPMRNPTCSRSPKRNSADAELSQSLHPSFKVSPKRQSSKDKPLIFGGAKLPTRSRSPMRSPTRSRSPTRNSADAELSQSLHPSFKVSTNRRNSNENDHSANPTFSHATATNEPSRSSDGFLSPTKPQSLRVSLARRQAKMEDFASGWNSSVSLSDVDMPDTPQRMQSSQSGSSRWNPNISPVAEDSTVYSFTHVADELSASVGVDPSVHRIMKPMSLSDLAVAQNSQPNLSAITRGIGRTRSLPQSPIMKIESARLKVRKNEEILASLMTSKNERPNNMPDNSLGKKLEVDLDSEKKRPSSVDGDEHRGANAVSPTEKRKFTLFPHHKQKSPELADKKAVDRTVTDGTKGKDGSGQEKDLKNEMRHKGDEEKGDSSDRQNRKKPAHHHRRSRNRDEGRSSNSKDGNGSGKSNAKEDRGRASSSKKKVSPDNDGINPRSLQ